MPTTSKPYAAVALSSRSSLAGSKKEEAFRFRTWRLGRDFKFKEKASFLEVSYNETRSYMKKNRRMMKKNEKIEVKAFGVTKEANKSTWGERKQGH